MTSFRPTMIRRARRWNPPRWTLLLPAALLLTACSTLPFGGASKPAAKPSPDQQALIAAEADLKKLQAEPALAARAPNEIRDAQAALQRAQSPSSDPVLAAHERYMAEHRVMLARARAEEREAVAQLQAMARQTGNSTLAAAAGNVLPSAPLPPPPPLPKPSALPVPSLPPPPTPSTTPPVEAAPPTVAEQAPGPAAPPPPSIPPAPPEAESALPPAVPPTPSAPPPPPAAVAAAAPNVATLAAGAFSPDGGTLLDSGSASLTAIADAAKAQHGAQIEVDGYSGDDGSDNRALSLAQRRAETVKHALVALGIEPARISATGMGEWFPPGTPVEPRSPRVEITVLP